MGDRTTSVEGVLLTPDAMFGATVQGNPGSAYYVQGDVEREKEGHLQKKDEASWGS